MTCSAPVAVCVGHLLKTASNSSLTSQLSEPVTPVEANKRMTRILKKDKWIQGKSRQSFEKYSQVAGDIQVFGPCARLRVFLRPKELLFFHPCMKAKACTKAQNAG